MAAACARRLREHYERAAHHQPGHHYLRRPVCHFRLEDYLVKGVPVDVKRKRRNVTLWV